MAVKCPHCREVVKPDAADRFTYCICSSVFVRRNSDGSYTWGGPDGVTPVEVIE